MTVPTTDDVTVVSRQPLEALLEWAAERPCGVEVKAAQCRLRDELAAPEPPLEEWAADLSDPRRCPKPGCAALLLTAVSGGAVGLVCGVIAAVEWVTPS